MGKGKRKKKNKQSASQHEKRSETPPKPGLTPELEAKISIPVAAVVLIVFAATLISYAGGAVLFTDECFHATYTKRIAGLNFSSVVDEYFSGLLDSTPPMLYFFTAIPYLIFGEAAFAYMNIFLFLVITVVGGVLVAKHVSPLAAAGAVMGFITSRLTVMFALRFYHEMNTALVFSGFLALIYLAYTRERFLWTILAGVSLGILLLTKQTAYVLPGLLLMFFLWLAYKKNWIDAKKFVIIGVIGFLMWLPKLIQNYYTSGSPLGVFMNPVKGELNLQFHALQTAKWKSSPYRMIEMVVMEYRAVCVVLAAVAVLYLSWRTFSREKKKGFELILLLIAGGFVGIIAAGSGNEPRHFLMFLPAFGLFGMLGILYALERVDLRKFALFVVLGLSVYGFIYTTQMPDYRKRANTPEQLLYADWYIRDHTPEDALVMALWTYSTGYHSNRLATWPQRLAPESPIDLYLEKNPDKFLEICRKRKIEYILVDYFRVRPEPDSANYPQYFVNNIDVLRRRGKASLFYPKDSEKLINNRRYAQQRRPFMLPNPLEVGPPDLLCIPTQTGCIPQIMVYKIDIR